MKKIQIVFIVLLTLGILALAYFVGYFKGERDDDRAHLHLSIDKDIHLYQVVERGNLNDIKSELGFFIFGDYNFYKTHYSSENWSKAKLEEARQIATAAATNGDVIWFSNLTDSTNQVVK